MRRLLAAAFVFTLAPGCGPSGTANGTRNDAGSDSGTGGSYGASSFDAQPATGDGPPRNDGPVRGTGGTTGNNPGTGGTASPGTGSTTGNTPGTGGTASPGTGGTPSSPPGPPAPPVTLPAPACAAAPGGSAMVAPPTLKRMLAGNANGEGWLGSPAVADLDNDGQPETVVARGADVVVFRADGSLRASARIPGSRIWAAPLVGNFVGDARREIVAACRGTITMLDADLRALPGFPVTYRDEVRSLAAADLDADGKLEIVAGTISDLKANGQVDILTVFRGDGTLQRGFPPNTTGVSGCDTNCYTHAGFDQNLALGPLDTTPGDDIFLPQDNAYVSIHSGDGVAFDANLMFKKRKKVLGVRFLHTLSDAQQGYADDEEAALQAHFTNSAPAIADLDGDGENELIMVGSVQNAAQSDRKKGVALWVIHKDGTRPPAFATPFHVPAYLAGLEDLGGNVVGLTNAVAVADLDPAVPGLDVVFAGYDGKLHLVGAGGQRRWSFVYTTDATVLTAGPVIGDLSGDGVPEIVFATYATVANKSALFVLDAAGNERARVALPGRGAMAAPTLADADGDGTLDVLVNLKDAVGNAGVQVFGVASAKANCLPWPTGRANLLRSGYLPRN
jgi:hypothetical protein